MNACPSTTLDNGKQCLVDPDDSSVCCANNGPSDPTNCEVTGCDSWNTHNNGTGSVAGLRFQQQRKKIGGYVTWVFSNRCRDSNSVDSSREIDLRSNSISEVN